MRKFSMVRGMVLLKKNRPILYFFSRNKYLDNFLLGIQY